MKNNKKYFLFASFLKVRIINNEKNRENKKLIFKNIFLTNEIKAKTK